MKSMTWARVKMAAAVCAATLAGTGGILAAGEPAAVPAKSEAGTTLLGLGSYWRVYITALPPVVTGDKKDSKPFGSDIRTALPPAGWARPDFDDSWWFRSPGPVQCNALTCIRGKFDVADPAAVGNLTLTLSYAGGARVYLNGKEVARAHLPKGDITPGTPASVYPQDAYLDTSGKPILSSKGSNAARVEVRRRKLGPLALPTGLLRKGVNVLAIELHRSAFRPVARRWKGKYKRAPWPHVKLFSLRLAADGAAVPNVSRPDGVQVWNQDPHRLFSVWEYGDPNEKLRPVRLVGARGGVYSGVVVISSTAAISGLKVTASGLGGAGEIPAAGLRVRCARPISLGISASLSGTGLPGYRKVPAFAALDDELPARAEPKTLNIAGGSKRKSTAQRKALGLPGTAKPAALVPVWVTVSIPKDAPAGKFRTCMSISADGMPARKVPLELEVVNWTLPAPGKFRTCMSIYQSPESVAMQYGVPLWSEKHWGLLEESFKLLSYVSNRLLVVPLVTRTQFGNDESMIPWIKGADGGYKYDFKVYDRYAALAAKHCNIKVISYQVYLSHGWTAPGPDKPTFVTVVDPATGKREPMKLPAYGTAEAEKLWKPFIAELKKHQAKTGFDKKFIAVLGITQDGGVHRGVADFFNKLWPEAGWHYGAHNRPTRKRAGGKVFGFSEYLYVPWAIPSLAKGRRHGWRNAPLVLMCQRISDRHQLSMVMRTMAERALLLGDNGAGRMCLDYWPVKGSTRFSATVNLFDRWPASACGQRQPQVSYLSVPGKKGALSTIRIEALREGLQEAEARIFVEEALVDKKIAGELAAKAWKLLDERAEFCRLVHSNRKPIRFTCGAGWQRRSARLYHLAAEVAGKLK